MLRSLELEPNSLQILSSKARADPHLACEAERSAVEMTDQQRTDARTGACRIRESSDHKLLPA